MKIIKKGDRMTNDKFRQIVEAKKSELKKRGSCGSSSDLCINEENRIAVIGIKTPERKSRRDTIYIVQVGKNGKIKTKIVLDEKFTDNSKIPTVIYKHEKGFASALRNKYGEFSERKHEM